MCLLLYIWPLCRIKYTAMWTFAPKQKYAYAQKGGNAIWIEEWVGQFVDFIYIFFGVELPVSAEVEEK